MTQTRQDQLLQTLQARFEANMLRHPGLRWQSVSDRIAQKPGALKPLRAMEDSGGEPDVIGLDPGSGQILFCDCAAESPLGRRSLCFDRAALDARKENKPAGSALEAAAAMGIELLNESQYRSLQKLGEFDAKTSSWLATPEAIRRRGGALFGDLRYGQVFIYHNGVQSYYAARGFRGLLRV